MPRLPRPVVERVARYGVRPWLNAPPAVRRPVLEAIALGSPVPGDIEASRQARGGVLGDLVAPAGWSEEATVLYLHGGAYEAASPSTHRALLATLAAGSGLSVFAAEYRLAPEHPAPAALEDAVAAYTAMTIHGTPVALAGDSAGGGLALAVAQAAGADGLPAPRALALISPWVDLTLSGESCRTKSDAMLTLPALERAAAAYARELGPRHRTCSPLRGDLRGLPPTLVHVGGEELLLSDAESLARAAREAGVDVELRVFTGLFHDFHTFAGILAEADEALAEMGAWIAARVAAA